MYFLSGVGEGEKNNFSCLLVLGLFRVVRLLLILSFGFFVMALCFFVLALVFGQNLPRFDIAPSVVRRRNAFFLLFLACKSRNSGELQAKTPRQTDFFGENRDFGREFLAS